ncbi:MAG: hypothetical protein ABIT38_04235, partial [Gemmatimonadaceae bacterium]
MSLGRGRVRAISGHHHESLTTGWEVACTPPNAVSSPSDLASAALEWFPATVPSTAASTLAASGRWSVDGTNRAFDADDWWYRTRFSAPPPDAGSERWLAFEGLATLARVWLNGQELVDSNGMFTSYSRQVDALLRDENELAICFHSLDHALAAKRPRPRWRVPMLEQQQLRWHRATLLGRTPGWSPSVAAVGPWRPVGLERRSGIRVDDVRLRAEADGSLDVSCLVAQLDGAAVESVDVLVERLGVTHAVALTLDRVAHRAAGRVVVPNVARWWPHTHGESPLYNVQLA